MGILDFLAKKDPKAPAPAGSTATSAAPADALKAEINKHGLDLALDRRREWRNLERPGGDRNRAAGSRTCRAEALV
jgi:hypothetical protein